MKALLFIILSLSLACCGGKITRKEAEGKMSYADFVDGDFRGVTAKKIEAMLGAPDIVNQAKGCEVWHYGPNPEQLIKGEAGAIIGVSVFFDEQGKVREITAGRKTTSGIMIPKKK
jgi:hypothetical protein